MVRNMPAAKPERPPHLPHGRWLGDFPDLSDVEKRLVKDCAAGTICKLGTTRPETATAANTIRAGLIRFLALGGDAAHPVHEKGLHLEGAWIEDRLDLEIVTATASLQMVRCRFGAGIGARDSKLPSLYLDGSQISDLRADGATICGNVHLRSGFNATGAVRLLGAQIGGDLTCTGGTFGNADEAGDALGFALCADRIVVKGGVFLNAGFNASGEVRLLGAQIGGMLSCRGGTFSNADEAGNPLGDALNADGVVVTGALFLRGADFTGGVDLTAAHASSLLDDAACWPDGGIRIDGFRYDRIAEGPTDAATRITWLQKQSPAHIGDDFRPQPWEQLIKVLREMGHPADAAEVAIAKQLALRKAGKIQGRGRNAMHWLYGWLAGFGHQPMRLVGHMVTLWLAAAFFFSVGAEYGYIGPSTPLLNSPTIAREIDDKCGHRFELEKQHWTKCAAMPAEYSTFQPLLYSLDLILPLVELQQDKDWGPIVEESPGNTMRYGAFLRWLMWFEILFGWFASLMFVAIVGRLVDKD